ncbi:prepilin-type N-terminal cleavage/methylation domain-containing protein [Myxococcus sp. MISCRS1]|uniref:type II secretion system protein GspJ n=1 Tax=unclassified Myxococcus TaxID=2648731 RepID=UPI001CBC7043|nr:MULTISPECIES: type II secretion system protein GspJ [unclassified Myxococcus]MBZ4396988.1 prepilin-type N-terminal cleavage/methylation domain-containing protein [Myxococcus sp. AS-1-15]MCY0996598.1 prepilin-type N-terminal cleavage/methylation domain-containing protein [Myxococcus sp. MISCRS1]BDT33384.1 prepilin-type N-terminal cleavage/methylation domain-containing protein [Myxococcus sp. MH1]
MTRRVRGFTLMEVMVAVAITALMGTVVAMAFQTGLTAKETVEADADRYRQLRVAMNRMSREIGSAYVSDRFDLKRFRDQQDRPSNFVGESDRLLFTTFAHQRLYTDVKESDQAVVEYFVDASEDKTARGRQDLKRRVNPNVDDRMDRGGTTDVLLEGVKKLEFEYWNSEKKEWDDEWDTRRPEQKSILPTRVRVTVTAVDETGKEARYSTQTRIMLNTELPRY